MAVLDVDWNPEPRRLRGFGLVALVAFGALGAWVHFRRSLFGFGLGETVATPVALALAGLAVACALLAVVAPRALRPLWIALTAIGLPIGWVVSHVLLAVAYYGVITPIGLVLRLAGRDLLERRLDRAATSYWRRRERVGDRGRYFRQF